MYLKAYLSVNRKLLSPGHRTNYTETRRVVGGWRWAWQADMAQTHLSNNKQ